MDHALHTHSMGEHLRDRATSCSASTSVPPWIKGRAGAGASTHACLRYCVQWAKVRNLAELRAVCAGRLAAGCMRTWSRQ